MRSTLLALGVLVGVGTVSNATITNAPVRTNAYIVQNGLDWAWASPLPAFIGDLSNPPNNGLDLSFQSQFGWGIPTFAQLVMAPLATAITTSGRAASIGEAKAQFLANWQKCRTDSTPRPHGST
jgi:hypothetical protein